MLNIEEPFDYYLDRLRNGDSEAIFGLMELGPEALPLIEKAIASVQNSSVRQDLVHVAWQTRVPTSIKILASSMNDPSPAVWKEAIDGLVTLASPEAVDVLRRAREQAPDRPTHGRYSFIEWIDDALQQIKAR